MILVDDDPKVASRAEKTVVYRRGSSSENKSNWDGRVSRWVKHDIQTVVVGCGDAHSDALFVVENLDLLGMRFKARRRNRYLRASQIGHIQEHLYWTALKRGLPIVTVSAAYSSQGYPNCHYADRHNRPTQERIAV